MGGAGGHLTAGDGGADRHRGPPLLRAPRHRLLPPGRGDAAHLLGRQAGRLDAHPAARPQPLPGRSGPRPLDQPQAEGGDHRAQDRGGVLEGRDPRDLPQHRALPLQRLGHRDGGAHLLRQAGAPAGCAGGRHPGGDAQGQQLLQPGHQPRARGGPPQHRAGPDGEARQARRGAAGRPPEEAPAHRLRAPAGGPRPGPPLCPAGAQVADRLGRPQRLQHLRRRAGGAHHPRRAPAGPGHPGGDPPGQPAAGAGRPGLGRAHGLGRQPGAGVGLHP